MTTWIVNVLAFLRKWWYSLFTKPIKPYSYRAQPNPYIPIAKNTKKPEWVTDKVIYLKAMMPNVGCGSIANTFNRLYSHKGQSVSKTFVYEKLKANQYTVMRLRRKIKHRKPKPIDVNKVWGMDITHVTLTNKQHLVLGILDHGSRALLKLEHIERKSSAALLQILIQTIQQFGLPKHIRTDNEACFNSKLIRFSLLSLGIRKQTTDVACPWQNGRVERAFGTFKQMWRQVKFPIHVCLQHELTTYQTWYNELRPHSHLDGATPKEILLNKKPKGKSKFVAAWDGILSGYYFPD